MQSYYRSDQEREQVQNKYNGAFFAPPLKTDADRGLCSLMEYNPGNQ